MNGNVAIELADGSRVTSSITDAAIEELGLDEGKPAVAIVEFSDVIVGVGQPPTEPTRAHDAPLSEKPGHIPPRFLWFAALPGAQG